ncbi:aldo/keto reductase [Pseudooceanicola sp. CBS1P-1]|uniref:Aldo/keto reductase n=1 Tax=Pseudooceanicola albus TaxID=2692189 RepID=A0A6L7FYN5_9RHOB|nr:MULTISPECIES: aldo/keto reductase [Pseudooceanicola]MBT9383441.1 aldo/keto reductase [Pseudooceanicola endophyticus]MXN16237.1 aldo/keto reductase [Pseudooceanicola albus]
MRKHQLGRSGIEVTDYCLGSMTWGNQTRSEAAHDQIDAALDAGINLLDTAEMYPVNPVRAETIGRTERIIGLWLEKTPHRRHELVIASKASGEGLEHVREGAPITPETLEESITGSLRRMKTDYIDVYQFHWPNRGSYHFRKNWSYHPAKTDTAAVLDNMRACLEKLKQEKKKGRIRAFGLSNESAWGMAQWIRLSEELDAPRPVSIQNEYSLLARQFDTDLAELCVYEDVGLLAYSPLATGLLTGKYQGRAVPKDSRMAINGDLGGRKTDRVFPAVDDYLDVALKHDLDPVHMALSFVASRNFNGSVIFGATNMTQLKRIIEGLDVTLSEEVLKDLDAVHRKHPMPF